MAKKEELIINSPMQALLVNQGKLKVHPSGGFLVDPKGKALARKKHNANLNYYPAPEKK